MSRMNVVAGRRTTAGVLIAAALIAASALPASAAAPYDLRGTWDTFGSGGGYSGTFTITKMNLSTGAFSGTGDGTTFLLKGVEHGSSVSFTQSSGAYVSHDDATIVRHGGTLQMTAGTWKDSNGAGGTFTASLKAAPSSPAPVAGSSAAAGLVSGSLRVRRPGATAFAPLTATTLIPIGSTVDATHGRVRLTVAASGGATHSGEFYGGEFTLGQGANGIATLTLAGGVRCAAGAAAGTGRAAGRAAAPRKRKLWGDAHGGFSTSGRYASASELGTRWLTADRCTGTLIEVASGAVRVRDLVRHRSFVLHAPSRRLVPS